MKKIILGVVLSCVMIPAMADSFTGEPKWVTNTVYLSEHPQANPTCDDHDLVNKVTMALQNDSSLRGQYVSVSANNGTLKLVGKMQNVSMIYRVLEDAQKTGVKLSNIDESELVS